MPENGMQVNNKVGGNTLHFDEIYTGAGIEPPSGRDFCEGFCQLFGEANCPYRWVARCEVVQFYPDWERRVADELVAQSGGYGCVPVKKKKKELPKSPTS